jgi:chitinase
MKKAIIVLLLLLTSSLPALAAQVTLTWDANNPAPSGYRIYSRTGSTYDYTTPAWEGTVTTCTITIPDGKEAAFVARAFVIGEITGTSIESANSNEAIYTPPAPAAPKNLLAKLLLALQKFWTFLTS